MKLSHFRLTNPLVVVALLFEQHRFTATKSCSRPIRFQAVGSRSHWTRSGPETPSAEGALRRSVSLCLIAVGFGNAWLVVSRSVAEAMGLLTLIALSLGISRL